MVVPKEFEPQLPPSKSRWLDGEAACSFPRQLIPMPASRPRFCPRAAHRSSCYWA